MKKKVFITLFLSIFTAMLGVGIIIPLLPLYAQTLGATGIWLGLIFSSFSLSRSLFMPIIGRLSDKKGRKIFLCIGLFGYSLISLGFINAAQAYQIGIVRFLQGFFAAMIIPVAMAYIGEIAPEKQEGKYMGTFNIALFAGFGSGPLIGGALKDNLGMDTAFLTMGALSLIAFILVFFFLPELHLYKKGWETPRIPYVKMLANNNIVKAITVFRLINSLGWGMIMAFLPIFAHTYLELNGSQIGLLISGSILLSSFFQAPFGRLADRMPRWKLVTAGGLITSFAILLIPRASSFSHLLFINMAMGIAAALSTPAVTALSVEEGRHMGMGSVMGIFNMAMSLGLASGPLMGGIIMDSLGVKFIFLFGGSIGFISIGLFVWLIHTPSGCLTATAEHTGRTDKVPIPGDQKDEVKGRPQEDITSY